jgi:hypothetical protein
VLDEAVPALHDDAPITLTLAELVGRLPVDDFTFDLVRRSQDLGLVELTTDGVVVKVPAFLHVGQTLARLGVPGAAIIDAYEHLRAQVAVVADDFVEIFDRYIEQSAAGDITKQAEQLDALTVAATDVVAAELRRALRSRAEARLGGSASA